MFYLPWRVASSRMGGAAGGLAKCNHIWPKTEKKLFLL
jgi:hypothetical protein